MRKVLVTAAVLSPALAFGADGSFVAVDNAWRAGGGAANELTIAPGQTVEFSYPTGNSFHNVVFEDPQPSSCTGVQPDNPGPGWKGSCRFDDAGTFAFVCGVHDAMTGRVIVRAAPTPTPTGTPTATPGPPGDAGAIPAPETQNAPPPPATTLKVILARTQRSMRVRGAVDVPQAGSRLEVTARTTRRVGRFLRRSVGPGTVVFSVGLDAKARKALRAKGRLTLTVRIVVSHPGATAQTRRGKTTLTRG
jgi:plastocyanin